MHRIEFLSNDQLPEGQDFVLICHGDGVFIGYRESAVCPRVLEDSWAAFRALQQVPPRRPYAAPLAAAL